MAKESSLRAINRENDELENWIGRHIAPYCSTVYNHLLGSSQISCNVDSQTGDVRINAYTPGENPSNAKEMQDLVSALKKFGFYVTEHNAHDAQSWNVTFSISGDDYLERLKQVKEQLQKNVASKHCVPLKKYKRDSELKAAALDGLFKRLGIAPKDIAKHKTQLQEICRKNVPHDNNERDELIRQARNDGESISTHPCIRVDEDSKLPFIQAALETTAATPAELESLMEPTRASTRRTMVR